MNKEYKRALSIAEKTLCDLKEIHANAEYKEFEDSKALKALEEVIEEMEGFIREIKHFLKPAKEGYLNINLRDRFELNNTELTCGYPIEMYNSKYDEWENGRIEHDSKYNGYYFYNYDGGNRKLSSGAKARIRV